MNHAPLNLSRPAASAGLDILPHAIEAEHAVLAGVLLDGIRDREVVGNVLDQLPPEAFYLEDHRLIYAAARQVREAGEWPDPVVVSDVLRAAGDLDRVGGLEYLIRLLDGVPSAANLRAHATPLHSHALASLLEPVRRRVPGSTKRFADHRST